MKNKYIFYSSYITVFISFIAFQIFCSILIQPIQLSAQTRDFISQSRGCRYITPIGLKRFTREEQRERGFNSGQNLLCYARVQNCQPINPGSDVIPITSSLVMCDTGSCSFHSGCMCPTDPMECFRDDIDGRSRYRNGQRMVRPDEDISCRNVGPMRAKVFTREEQRHHGFSIEDNTYLCYSNVRNCRVNGMPVNTDIFICDTAWYDCSIGIAGGILCSCPTNLSECAKDAIDGHSAYTGGREMIQTDEEPSNPRRQRRPSRRGRGRE